MNRRAALSLLFGATALTAGLAGCSEAPPAPPGGNPENAWSDEVKQAEAAREAAAKARSAKKGR